ncbi:MAG TPA: tail fiber domain-containing protein [Chitinophagaceae bacterium]
MQQTGWNNYSGERIKDNVKENIPGLQFIKALRPVTYNFSLAKENDVLGRKNDTATRRGKYGIEK